MTEPIRCEARLMGLSKTRRKDGDWVEIKFHIHPDDHPAALFILPLGTDCNLAISGVPESKDDAPDEPVKLKGGPLARQAGMLYRTHAFQRYMIPIRDASRDWETEPPTSRLSEDERLARQSLCYQCQVFGPRYLDHSDDAAITWAELVNAYYASQHGETTEAFEAMKGEGPG